MTRYFRQKNWEPRLYERLNDLIDRYKQPLDLPSEERDYVIFDCDDTTIYSDIETESLYHCLENLNFHWTPEKFEHVIRSGDFDYHKPLDPHHAGVTGDNLVHDIMEAYEELYALYIKKAPQERPPLSEVRRSEAFSNLFVKYIKFYDLQWAEAYEKPGISNAVAFFAGHSYSQLTRLILDCTDAFSKVAIEEKEVYSSAVQTGKTGLLSVKTKKGMRFPEEMKDLYDAFQDQGLTVYVVSGSPKELVAPPLGRHFHVPYNQVYSMRYAFDEGRMTEFFSPHHPTTLGSGKVQTINERIIPKHKGRQPLAVFGNSSGDYDMMTLYEEMELGVFFNRNIPDKSQAIVKEAVETFDEDQPRYMLQGMDENTGTFRPSQSTIPLGRSESLLYARDEEVRNKYSLS